MDRDRLQKLLGGIRLLRPPTRKLSTFGDTRIEYRFFALF